MLPKQNEELKYRMFVFFLKKQNKCAQTEEIAQCSYKSCHWYTQFISLSLYTVRALAQQLQSQPQQPLLPQLQLKHQQPPPLQHKHLQLKLPAAVATSPEGMATVDRMDRTSIVKTVHLPPLQKLHL